MDLYIIGQFIAKLRKEKGLTQEQLGDELGVTNKTISRWENGNYMPDIEMLQIMSNYFNVSINEILSGRKLEIEEYKECAEKNIIEVMEEYTSTFSFEDKYSYFSKKWLKEHIFNFIICAVITTFIFFTIIKLLDSNLYLTLCFVPLVIGIEYVYFNGRKKQYILGNMPEEYNKREVKKETKKSKLNINIYTVMLYTLFATFWLVYLVKTLINHSKENLSFIFVSTSITVSVSIFSWIVYIINEKKAK